MADLELLGCGDGGGGVVVVAPPRLVVPQSVHALLLHLLHGSKMRGVTHKWGV